MGMTLSRTKVTSMPMLPQLKKVLNSDSLIFPSGEALPLCWFDSAYRQHMSIPDIAVHT